MGDEQLELTLRDTIKNLFHLRFQSATERLETPSEIRKARREVARIQTILRERELVKAKAAAKAQAAQAPPPPPAPAAAPAKTAPQAAQPKKKPAPAKAQKGK